MRINERSFFCRTCHSFLILFAAAKSQRLHKRLLAAAVHEHVVCALVVARLVSTGGLSPGRDRMASARGLALTATMRMVDRVHDHAAVSGTNTQPARAPCLA